MPRQGKIANGSDLVQIEGKRAARQTDLLDHAGLIGEGCASVLVGAASKPAARLGDRFLCPMMEDSPHVGGHIVSGATTVLVGDKQAARQDDVTLCLGEEAAGGALDGLSSGGSELGADPAASCRALWEKYDQEARDIIAPAGDDHRKRNHIINGAYASLYLRNRGFKWAGLAAYASKQVGCAMDHAQKTAAESYNPAARDVASYTYEKLGDGNRSLFLDIYPMHRFYEEQGWENLRACAGERVPPVPAAALDGFEALERGDYQEHVRSIAFHEQVNILQRDVYNDDAMRFILERNESNYVEPLQPAMNELGTKPADVVMTDSCSDPTGDKTIPFKRDDRSRLYDVDERMDWIMNDIGGYYFGKEGQSEHLEHLGRLADTGEEHGGHLP